jgi:large subunit ribosomal protein L18
MVKKSSYNMPYRRRRDGKTDYKLRKGLVLSRLPRFVVRSSNKNITVQVIEAHTEADKVIVAAHSNELSKKYGWDGPCGNLPAAYLTGLLAGLRAVNKKVKKAVFDIGLKRSVKGSRVYAALKGGIDAGLQIPHGEDILPSEERIEGVHITKYAKKLSDETEEYKTHFSGYLAKKLKPEDVSTHFKEVKEQVLKEDL